MGTATIQPKEIMKSKNSLNAKWSRQRYEDNNEIMRLGIWGMASATAVWFTICATCSNESATHLVDCFRHIVANW